MSEHIVVLGAGQAAIAFAAKLRALNEDVKITLVGDELHLPYQRPPLSKKYVMGEMTTDQLALRAPQWYADNRVECLVSTKAERIDTQAKSVELDNGETLSFDRLIIATGSRPRLLPAEIGGKLENVFTIRNIDDADALKSLFQSGGRLLVIGGGYIGLEAAAVARGLGMEVTLVEMAERILQRVASSATSDFFRELHQSKGVEILENTGLKGLEGEGGKVKKAVLSNGAELDVDGVIVGIGIVTNSEIAEAAGIETDNGVRVNLRGETSVAGIYACGDCARFDFKGELIRLESVQNAIDQAENIAKNIAAELNNDESLSGDYHPVPWFWSDQYEVKLQIAGLNSGHDQVVEREGTREGSHSIWYFKDGQFIAVDSMSDPRAYMVGKRLLEMGKGISPEQAGDAECDIKDLLKA